MVLPFGALDLPAQAAAVAPITPLPPASPPAVPAEQPKIPPPMLAGAVGRPEDFPIVATPAAQKPRPTNIVIARLLAKRRSHLTDEQLRKQLLLTTEAALEAVPGATQNLLAGSVRTAGAGLDLAPALMAQRTDLFGLRPRTGIECRMSKEEALTLQVLSQILRRHVETSMPGVAKGIIDLRPDAEVLRGRLFDAQVRGQWLKPEAIPTLRQLLMHEDRNARLILVEALAQMRQPQASVELAQRALFDLHADVRDAALVALHGRDPLDYEHVLIAGLRYPWPAIADHAAEALVALDLRGTVPRLLPLLDAKDPGEPIALDWGGKRIAVVTELVRVSHLRNCLLCHPASHSPADPLRAVVPNVIQRVPLPFSGEASGSGAGAGGYNKGGAGSGQKSTFIRADITYLRQDFSVLQPVPNHGPLWPAEQRFDYLLRLRPLDNRQLQLVQDQLLDFRAPSPHREALLFALRELTGENPGPSAEDWRRVYSTVSGERLQKALTAEDRMPHLRDTLTTSKPLRQAELLLAYRDRAGRDYDDALAQAIPRLKAELQKLGRTVLADRLHRSRLLDLQDGLGHKDPELRLASATVCGWRGEKSLIPNLIGLLVDDCDDVAKHTHLALRELTRQDFGPRWPANLNARQQAMTSWRDWWDKQERKAAKQKGAP